MLFCPISDKVFLRGGGIGNCRYFCQAFAAAVSLVRRRLVVWRLKGLGPRLGAGLQSTDEVACFGAIQSEACFKAMLAGRFKRPTQHAVCWSSGGRRTSGGGRVHATRQGASE